MNDNATPFNATLYEAGIKATVPYYEQFYSETIDFILHTKPKPAKWLDTGCGTGSLISDALKIFETTQFILADPSLEMLNKAKHNLNDATDRVTFIEPVGTENIYLPDILNIEVITAIQSHHYFNKLERQQATENGFNLLSKNGLYITFENFYPNSDVGKDISLARWKSFQLSQGRDEDSVKKHIGRFNQAYFPIRIDEHLALLRECGFRIAEIFWLSHMQVGIYAIK